MDELREYLKKELGVTDEQYEELVAQKREVSPVNDLQNIAFVEGMQMGMIDNLGAMVGALMVQITALEARINELEGGVANA